MWSLLPLTVYCISLVCLQQLLALPAEERPDTNRLDLLNKLLGQREDNSVATGSQTNSAVPSSGPSQSPKWLPGFLRHPPASGARTASPGLAWARPSEAVQMEQKLLRARRHAHTGSRGGHHYPHHAQLMRVGCVLGTCQVQNLSHRLYQLIGQSGREDSSPINPKSPHSYG
ncbi:protein ADM2a [Embiotoca jacksoni]|uniref:protein ADM2a n=1 Tax=Embiotoca jacksoni TaxID=100190 RepID=UPI003703F272